MSSDCMGCDACETTPCNGGCVTEESRGRSVHVCLDEAACFGAFLRIQRRRTGAALFGVPATAFILHGGDR